MPILQCDNYKAVLEGAIWTESCLGSCLQGVRLWRIVHRGFDFSFRFQFPLARMRCIPRVLLPQHQTQVSVRGRRRPAAAAYGLGAGEASFNERPTPTPSGSAEGADCGVAVGMLVARRPPHRFVRAEFPHTALTLGVWRRSGRWGKDVGCGVVRSIDSRVAGSVSSSAGCVGSDAGAIAQAILAHPTAAMLLVAFCLYVMRDRRYW